MEKNYGLFLMARPLRGGGKGLATKKKYLFLKLEKKCQYFWVATKLEGGGVMP